MFQRGKVWSWSVKRWTVLIISICSALVYCTISFKSNRGRIVSAAKPLRRVASAAVLNILQQVKDRNEDAVIAVPDDNDVSANLGKFRTVLFWTPFFGLPDPRGNMGAALFQGCPVDRCVSTNNRSAVGKADALIFHAFDINPQSLPGARRTGQHYAFHIGECPSYSTNLPEFPGGFFDVTISYRLDSDILGHYLYSVPLEKAPKNFAEGKTKLVAWFVSNCNTHSKRENYVKELQNYVQVDIYGRCGPLKCPRDDVRACDQMLKTDYKFYLAFENSICQDYVTEKFTRALSNYVIPIFLGAGNMTIFPPGSYIHVDQFPSVRAMSDFIKGLDSNDTAYNEYMKWRFDSGLVASHGRYSASKSGWCQLCEKLHNPSFQPQNYPNVSRWHIDGGRCRAGTW